MSPDMEDLVETSNNVAQVIVENGRYSAFENFKGGFKGG